MAEKVGEKGHGRKNIFWRRAKVAARCRKRRTNMIAFIHPKPIT